jgi:hypothetical protein
MQQEFRLRDIFNPAAVEQLANIIAQAWPVFFYREGLATTINGQLEVLSFGGRNALIRATLRAYLPQEFPEAVRILLDALGPRSHTTNSPALMVLWSCRRTTLWPLTDWDTSTCRCERCTS